MSFEELREQMGAAPKPDQVRSLTDEQVKQWQKEATPAPEFYHGLAAQLDQSSRHYPTGTPREPTPEAARLVERIMEREQRVDPRFVPGDDLSDVGSDHRVQAALRVALTTAMRQCSEPFTRTSESRAAEPIVDSARLTDAETNRVMGELGEIFGAQRTEAGVATAIPGVELRVQHSKPDRPNRILVRLEFGHQTEQAAGTPPSHEYALDPSYNVETHDDLRALHQPSQPVQPSQSPGLRLVPKLEASEPEPDAPVVGKHRRPGRFAKLKSWLGRSQGGHGEQAAPSPGAALYNNIDYRVGVLSQSAGPNAPRLQALRELVHGRAESIAQERAPEILSGDPQAAKDVHNAMLRAANLLAEPDGTEPRKRELFAATGGRENPHLVAVARELQRTFKTSTTEGERPEENYVQGGTSVNTMPTPLPGVELRFERTAGPNSSQDQFRAVLICEPAMPPANANGRQAQPEHFDRAA